MKNYGSFLKLLVACTLSLFFFTEAYSQAEAGDLLIRKTADFAVSGNGNSKEWNSAEWLTLTPRRVSRDSLQTRVKALYSDKGLSFLFDARDVKLTPTMKADFLDLWKEDVVEVFVQTDSTSTSYFEYEVSPYNFELPILISNDSGTLRRWMPFHYEQDRRTIHKTSIQRKNNTSSGEITGWTAEFFIPYTLLFPLNNVFPKSGMRWKGNFYRVDYDHSQYASWTWQPTRQSFHDMERFGTFVFE